MDAELEGVPATDELRRQIAEVIADYHGRMIQAHTLFRSYELAGELLPLVVAVVAEARTEGAIAALEDFDRRKSFGIENWRVHRDITNIVAALRGVGNQNAEPRWSANRLEEVLRDGLPDQNAEPVDTCGICGNPKRTGQNNFGTHQCPPY